MKRLSLLALFFLFASSSALACGGPDKGERIADRLGLDDTQSEQVMTILKEQRTKARESYHSMREQGVQRDSEEARAHHDAMQAETRERLSVVLSSEQLAEFDRMHEEKRKHMHERRQRHREREAAAI